MGERFFMWSIDYGYIEEWLDQQDAKTVAGVFAALEVLEREGPGLGRPLVDTLQGSRVKNLKELRPASPGRSEVRIIFAFDCERAAIMLLAGDKSKGKTAKARWAKWYKRAIPRAEELFFEHERKSGRSDG